MEPYGKRVSAMFEKTWGVQYFPNFHTTWAACRTKYINDTIENWMNKTEGKKQFLNLGCGMDTRAYWL